jgi:hypothetical protein
MNFLNAYLVRRPSLGCGKANNQITSRFRLHIPGRKSRVKARIVEWIGYFPAHIQQKDQKLGIFRLHFADDFVFVNQIIYRIVGLRRSVHRKQEVHVALRVIDSVAGKIDKDVCTAEISSKIIFFKIGEGLKFSYPGMTSSQNLSTALRISEWLRLAREIT